MNCEQMTALLSAFVDGELSAGEEMQVQEHLKQCPECRVLYEQLQALHTSFSDLEEIPAPENFVQGVMSRIKAEEKPKVIPLFKRPQVRAVMGLAACAVLCIGFGRFALDGSGKSAPQEPAMAASDAAVYDAVEYSMEVQTTTGGVEARMESAPVQWDGMAQTEAAAPVAPEPDQAPAEMQLDTEFAKEEKGAVRSEIILTALPNGFEADFGPLQWEERSEDGALCAHLTDQQVEILLELAAAGELDVEILSHEMASDLWTLILKP